MCLLWCFVCCCFAYLCLFCFFFFNDTATTEIYTLSLHDALPIFPPFASANFGWQSNLEDWEEDRKSTRLNSSHTVISYAVFCLKKKKKKTNKTFIKHNKKMNSNNNINKNN